MSNARFGLRVRNGLVRGITEGQQASFVGPDVLAFITAAGITDETQINAINQLVIDLKTFGLWTKMKAIYPFVGGNASSHRFNLKDPRDLDAAFRLIFTGGGTHTSTGWTPNGINGYADTFCNTSLNLSQNSIHLSYYSRTNISANSAEIGNLGCYLIYSYSGAGFKAFNSSQSIRGSIYTPTNGLLIGSRINSTIEKYYHKGNLIDTLTINSIAPSNSSIWLGNTNGTSNWSSKETAFASIGDGLTDTEAANFYTAVQTFQTTLGRQV